MRILRAPAEYLSITITIQSRRDSRRCSCRNRGQVLCSTTTIDPYYYSYIIICMCDKLVVKVVDICGTFFFHMANAASMNCALASISSVSEEADALEATMDARITLDIDLWVGNFHRRCRISK